MRIRTAKFVNFAVLLPMSAARDKLKCHALDLFLLAVTEKKTFAKRKGLEMAHPNGFEPPTVRIGI